MPTGTHVTLRRPAGLRSPVAWLAVGVLVLAGAANVRTGAHIRPDARMRLESISKLYAATAVFQLAQEGKLSLSDTVAKWLPGVLPYGDRITLEELMTDSSGLIDGNGTPTSTVVTDPTDRHPFTGADGYGPQVTAITAADLYCAA